RLGLAYERGLGVAKDEQQARRYYQKAAEQGDAAGMYMLGRLIRSQTRQMTEEVRGWYVRAAEKGHLEAMDALARETGPDALAWAEKLTSAVESAAADLV